MKKTQLQSLKEKSVEDLKKELKDSRDKLWHLGDDLRRGKVKNIQEIKSLKTLVAVILTVLREKEPRLTINH